MNNNKYAHFMTIVFLAQTNQKKFPPCEQKMQKFLSVHKHKISTHDLITKIDAIAFFCTVVITVPQLKYFFILNGHAFSKYAKNGLIF